jgi:hypothetical protein
MHNFFRRKICDNAMPILAPLISGLDLPKDLRSLDLTVLAPPNANWTVKPRENRARVVPDASIKRHATRSSDKGRLVKASLG